MTLAQICVVLEENYGKTLKNIYQLAAVLFALLREDMIYSDLHSYKYTCTKQEGYYNYSEIFRLKFPSGYAVDSIGRVIPTTARLVNLENLQSILISKNEEQYR